MAGLLSISKVNRPSANLPFEIVLAYLLTLLSPSPSRPFASTRLRTAVSWFGQFGKLISNLPIHFPVSTISFQSDQRLHLRTITISHDSDQLKGSVKTVIASAFPVGVHENADI